MVYIQEAHPVDAWQMPSNVREKILYTSTKGEEDRSEVAGACVRKLGIRIPALIDDATDSTETAYTAWPDRLYVIDPAGKVVWKSTPGPFGFDPDQMEAHLKTVLR